MDLKTAKEICLKVLEEQRAIFIEQKGYAPDTVYTSKKIRYILVEGHNTGEKLYVFGMEIKEHWCIADNGFIICRAIDIGYLPDIPFPPRGPDF